MFYFLFGETSECKHVHSSCFVVTGSGFYASVVGLYYSTLGCSVFTVPRCHVPPPAKALYDCVLSLVLSFMYLLHCCHHRSSMCILRILMINEIFANIYEY